MHKAQTTHALAHLPENSYWANVVASSLFAIRFATTFATTIYVHKRLRWNSEESARRDICSIHVQQSLCRAYVVAGSLCRDVVVASSRFATTFATALVQYMCKHCVEQMSWRICVASVVAQYMCKDCVEQMSWRANFDVTLSWRAHFSPRYLPRHLQLLTV